MQFKANDYNFQQIKTKYRFKGNMMIPDAFATKTNFKCHESSLLQFLKPSKVSHHRYHSEMRQGHLSHEIQQLEKLNLYYKERARDVSRNSHDY